MTHPSTEQAIDKAVERALSTLERRELLTGAQWADKHFYLSVESSLKEGRWKTLTWQIGILNAMTNDDIRSVFIMKSKRTGYTKMLMAATGYFIEQKGRKVGIWQPTDGDRDEFSLVEIDNLIRDVQVLRDKFPYFGKKNSRNTIKFKQFDGAPLYLRGGKAAKNYRRITLDVAIGDEYAAFDADIEKEGSGAKLMDGRTEGSAFRKLILGSTPKIKDECQMELVHGTADVELEYHWRCPHCDAEQVLEFGGAETEFGFKWLKGDPKSVAYQCKECATLIKQAEFIEVLESGECRWGDPVAQVWSHDNETFYGADNQIIDTPRSVGIHIWAGYSPFVQWWDIVTEWLTSCRDPIQTKTFLNTVLGTTYDIASGDRADIAALESRPATETYSPQNIPERICYVTAGVDVQPDRFEIQVLGWGVGSECWVLEYIVLPCDTQQDSSWETLDITLGRSYNHPKGATLSIRFTGIDTGGHSTQASYRYCKKYAHKGRLALKGRAGELPIIPLKPSKSWAMKGLKGWIVGVDTAKTQLYSRLMLAEEGQGYIHFPPQGLPEDYFKQLTAEKRRLRVNRSGRREYYWWSKEGARVEALDTFVYAIAALEHSGIDLGLLWKSIMEPQISIDMADLVKQLNG